MLRATSRGSPSSHQSVTNKGGDIRIRVPKKAFPEAPEGLVWSLRRRGDAVQLQLRTRRLRREVVADWSTEAFSTLAPDPVTALTEVATQMASNASREYLAAA